MQVLHFSGQKSETFDIFHGFYHESGVSSQRNVRNFGNVTKWRHYWIGQSQPSPAKLRRTRAKLF